MQRTEEQGSICYRITSGEKFFGVKVEVLEGAVPELPNASETPASNAFGVVTRGLPMPAGGGAYVVQCIAKDTVKPLAYLDPYGRAFSVTDVITVPPARVPNLVFSRYPQDESSTLAQGCVYVYRQAGAAEDDEGRSEVALFSCARNTYTLFDSWFNFGPYGANLTYNAALARAYLAFVHRPALGARAVPARGLLGMNNFVSPKPLATLRLIVADVHAADSDLALCPPALICCLATWLIEAGLHDLDGLDDDALRLVRTMHYAHTYYLSLNDEEADVSTQTLWALEAALNRFLLVSEALGDKTSSATDVDCARWDAYLIETVATQQPEMGNLVSLPQADEQGEWSARCAVEGAIERMRLPLRVEVSLRMDVSAGVAALNLEVPNAHLMPQWVFQESEPLADQNASQSGLWVQASDEMRAQQARRYAMHVGLLLTSVVFESCPSLNRVEVVACPLLMEQKKSSEPEDLAEFLYDQQEYAYFHAVFGRGIYESLAHFKAARAGDPLPAYEAAQARFDVYGADAFATIEALPSTQARRELPDTSKDTLTDALRDVLGADDFSDMRINYDAAPRRFAEGLADRVVHAQSASDAIRVVRAAQDEAADSVDDRIASCCTRLMAALAEGELEAGDQNAVVSSFLGEDRCLVALGRARTVAESDPMGAVDVLIDAVAETAALDGVVDGPVTVYRTFDSYAARVLYNRARKGLQASPAQAARDAGKTVELASDAFYLAHIEIMRLLEHSFERSEEAFRYGHRAIEIAPATALGYRQLGRAYMLVGDMDMATSILQDGLRVAIDPADIATSYYQLAYVLWKAGRAQSAAACYLKSLSVSPVVAVQATAELHELMNETKVSLVARDKIDAELERTGVVVAPTPEVLGVMVKGAQAAVNTELFTVARNLLSARIHYCLDDALVGVLHSLGE